MKQPKLRINNAYRLSNGDIVYIDSTLIRRDGTIKCTPADHMARPYTTETVYINPSQLIENISDMLD